jgi:CRISPR/Cas system CSM-associated protein Csm4 (group 5 of RAMP superfamily)
MSRLYRLKLKPSAPWRTPWQADTLTGMLLVTAARTLGPDALRRRLIDPMLAGTPPFVLSDALPGDLLPLPIHLRLSNWPEGTNLKAVKRARWLSPEHFEAARLGRRPPPEALLGDDKVFHRDTRQHNTLSRVTDASFSEQGGGIFQRPETLLCAQEARDFLSVYLRLLDRAGADLVLELFQQLSFSGFGADTSAGRGQFELPDDPQAMPHLDETPANANGVLSLSTFQPGPRDPTDGCWDAFPKFGKLGPDFGLADVRKNTLILLRAGACFRTNPSIHLLGRAIPMRELLPPNSFHQLVSRGVDIIHPAFALAVPITLPEQ